MSDLQAVLTIIGGLFALAVLVGGLYFAVRSSAQEARIKFLQGERDDYKGRLEWIEPRFKQAEEQNRLLRNLHNPTAQIEALGQANSERHQVIVTMLEAQAVVLRDVNEKLEDQRRVPAAPAGPRAPGAQRG